MWSRVSSANRNSCSAATTSGLLIVSNRSPFFTICPLKSTKVFEIHPSMWGYTRAMRVSSGTIRPGARIVSLSVV